MVANHNDIFNNQFNNLFVERKIHVVNLDDVLSMTDDEFEDNVLDFIRNNHRQSDEYKNTICFEASSELLLEGIWTTEHEARVQQIMNTIQENDCWVDVDTINVPKISGRFIAEWIRTNKNVITFEHYFNCEESILDLAYAIENDLTITTLRMGIDLQKPAIRRLSEAIRRNKSIRSLGIYIVDEVQFEQGIAFNKHIEHLYVKLYPRKDPSALNALESALTTNTSITSLSFRLWAKDFDHLDPTVSALVIPNRIKQMEFQFDQTASITEDIDANELVLIKLIQNTPQLEHIRIIFKNFKSLRGDLAKVLQKSHARIQLIFKIDDLEGTLLDSTLNCMIEEVSSWKRQPEVEILYLDAATGDNFLHNWKTLRKIRLTKCRIFDLNLDNFFEFIKELPSWKELEYFSLKFTDEELANQILTEHDKLAAAISDNYTITNVDILFNENVFINEQAKKWIEQTLQRNQFLAECRAAKGGIIPIELLPALMEFTKKNIDFLFEFVKAHAGQLFKINGNNKRKLSQMMSG